MDVAILRLVVLSLAVVCALCVVGITILGILGHDPPPTLGAIASMCGGALVGIVVTPRSLSQTSTDSRSGIPRP